MRFRKIYQISSKLRENQNETVSQKLGRNERLKMGRKLKKLDLLVEILLDWIENEE